MECIPHNASEDIYTCYHFYNDWDKEEWDKVYADKKQCIPDKNIASHRKFNTFEDGFNHCWKECVMFGCWLTFDKSCVLGWYHSPIMLGPDPKLICAGAAIHLLVVMQGDLVSYKVHLCVFGGAMEGDFGKSNDSIITTQKWTNQLLLILDNSTYKGNCITMDSAYIGDIMAMIGYHV